MTPRLRVGSGVLPTGDVLHVDSSRHRSADERSSAYGFACFHVDPRTKFGGVFTFTGMILTCAKNLTIEYADCIA